jgi:hypothetical protein
MLDRPLRYRAGGKVGKRCYVAGVAVSFYNREKGRHSTSHGSDENKPPVTAPHRPAMASNLDSPGRTGNCWQFVLFATVNRKICILPAGKYRMRTRSLPTARHLFEIENSSGSWFVK